jgi:ATP synthase protein I
LLTLGGNKSEVIIEMWQPFMRVVGMQVLGTLCVAAIAAWFSGLHGAISAILGGSVGAVGGLVFAFMVARSRDANLAATDVVYRALRAEGVKLVLMAGMLWLILANYHGVVIISFVGAFILSILVFQLALLVQVP